MLMTFSRRSCILYIDTLELAPELKATACLIHLPMLIFEQPNNTVNVNIEVLMNSHLMSSKWSRIRFIAYKCGGCGTPFADNRVILHGASPLPRWACSVRVLNLCQLERE